MVTPTLTNKNTTYNGATLVLLLRQKFLSWPVIGLVCFLIMLFNVFETSKNNNKATVLEKLEVIHPLPDGSNDYNLLKTKNTTSFNGFSFYLMGDTPVCFLNVLLTWYLYVCSCYFSSRLLTSKVIGIYSTEIGKKHGWNCK
jgi:hypothetical protein